MNDIASSIQLQISKLKSLEATKTFCDKFIVADQFAKETDVATKFNLLHGMTKGMKDQILIAVTGPRASHYNGKYGELANECNDFVADCWEDFFESFGSRFTLDQVTAWSTALSEKHRSEGYGYPHLLALAGDMMVKYLVDDEVKAALMAQVDKVEQYCRDKGTHRTWKRNQDAKKKALSDASATVTSNAPALVLAPATTAAPALASVQSPDTVLELVTEGSHAVEPVVVISNDDDKLKDAAQLNKKRAFVLTSTVIDLLDSPEKADVTKAAPSIDDAKKEENTLMGSETKKPKVLSPTDIRNFF